VTSSQHAPADLEQVRKHARILIIDDQDPPIRTLFDRDGYHLERWPEIKNLSQLTDGHYHLILLDIQGVGLNESPRDQGLGVLSHIKSSNPAQLVVMYSAQPQNISRRDVLVLADAVLDKDEPYVRYKEVVDRLLQQRLTRGYYISTMNRELGEHAILAPKAVPRAISALRTGHTKRLERYLRAKIQDPNVVDRVLTIISIGVGVGGLT
jgi:hypothetical protein